MHIPSGLPAIVMCVAIFVSIIIAIPVPGPPRDVILVESDGFIDITWSPPSSPNGEITGKPFFFIAIIFVDIQKIH